MSAGQLGKRLIEEVEERSLNELLSEIRGSASENQGLHLGIPSFDQILEIFQKPRIPPSRLAWISPQPSSDDSEYVYPGSITPSRPESWTARHGKKPPARTIQLTSSYSAAGKTSLLYHLSAFSILAKCYGGNEATIVWLDTDGRFSSLRLAQLYARMLQTRSIQSNELDLDAQVRGGLSHVHVFRPQSSAQLIATLKTVPDYLLSRNKHHSQQRPLGLVVLDSVTTFYWADRADAEVTWLSNPGAAAPPSTTSQIIAQLTEIEQVFGCAVAFTTDASLQRRNRTRLDSAARTVVDSPVPTQNEQVFQDLWTNFANITLNVHRVPVPQFAPAMTIEECAKDQPRRIEAVQRGRHGTQVMWNGSESNEIKEEVRKLQYGKGFGFKVTVKGVEIESPSSL